MSYQREFESSLWQTFTRDLKKNRQSRSAIIPWKYNTGSEVPAVIEFKSGLFWIFTSI